MTFNDLLKREKEIMAKQRVQYPILVEMGWEPYDTESAARSVADFAQSRIAELEQKLSVAQADSEVLKGMVARYLVAIYDVPIRQVDCQMDTDKIDQLHDDIVDEIGQEYIAKAQEGGE